MSKEPWQIPLAEFIGTAPVRGDIGFGDESVYYTPSDVDMDSVEDTETLTGGRIDGYYVGHLRGRPKDVIALRIDEYEDWDVIGQYIGDALIVEPEHRGCGLGIALVLAAARGRGGSPRAVEYTPLGRKAHLAAHRMAVEIALDEDESVPDDVLADYPDLKSPKP